MDNLKNLDGKLIYIGATVLYFLLLGFILWLALDIRTLLKAILEEISK